MQPLRTASLLLVPALFLLTGCGAMGMVSLVGGAAATASSGHQYLQNTQAVRSYNAPYASVFAATRSTLTRMSIAVQGNSHTATGDHIDAYTGRYSMTVDLLRVTPQITRVTVVAGNNLLDRDKATAMAVIEEVGETLQRSQAAAGRRPDKPVASL